MTLFITSFDALESIAQLIKQKRLNINMTQVELSLRSNVSLSVLRKFERTGKISLESFIKLSIILGVIDNVIDGLKNCNQEFSSMDDLLNEKRIKIRKKAHK